MTDVEGYDIRYSEMADGRFLLKWLSDPSNNRWFPMSTEKEIEIGVANWIGFSRFKASLTATVKGIPCGIGTLFLMPYRKVAHHCMFYMIVENSWRNKGIGTSLLRNVLNLAEKYFRLESINAEVFEGCPILSIMKKLDFEVFAYQQNYVKEKDGYLARVLLEKVFKEGS